MKSGLPGVPELGPWISSKLSPGQVVGVDPTLISGKEALHLQKSLSSKNIQLIGENADFNNNKSTYLLLVIGCFETYSCKV